MLSPTNQDVNPVNSKHNKCRNALLSNKLQKKLKLKKNKIK